MEYSATGLTTGEAHRRLDRDGPNSIVDFQPNMLSQALRKLWGPVPWLLEAAICLQIFLGDYVQAGVVAVLVVFNGIVGVFQEGKAKATLKALQSRLALTAVVKRDGDWKSVTTSELVAGDVVKLSLGAIVPADVSLKQGSALLDQSMLTGESLPTEAEAGALAFAGALVRRGEAIGEVTATGTRTKFGKTAELVRTAKAKSTEQKAVLGVVRNLVLFNGALTAILAIYAFFLSMPLEEIISLMLVALLSSIPVALPSMFTLAAAIGAQALAKQGVLPTNLSAVDEAASIDILCSDKTGTLTRNALTVMSVRLFGTIDEPHLLGLAALASSDGGVDPVDSAIRRAAAVKPANDNPALLKFVAFDPDRKRSEAIVRGHDGTTINVSKGAFTVIQGLAECPDSAASAVKELQQQGFRVLAVAAGAEGKLAMIGLIALSDPPRADSAALIAELAKLGVRTIMVTGDAAVTANVVAHSVGISGPTFSTTPIPEGIDTAHYAVFAGVLPEDKYGIVKALQKNGHNVGMCGDGVNDAPALRQAQMGIAVSTATDVAKSAAGIVLTQPGLSGVVTLIKEGRTTFQRILTFTLRSITHKIGKVLFLIVGLAMTGHAILTPTLMILMMVTGDFLALSSSTDNVRPSQEPNTWRIKNLMIAGIILGAADLAFCIACLAIAKYEAVPTASLQTIAVVTLVFSGQSVLYVSREREHLWSSMPSNWLVASSFVDIAIVSVLALGGILMAPLTPIVLASLFFAAVAFAFVLDWIKLLVFRYLDMS